MNTLNDSQEVSTLGIVSFRCCPGGFQFPSFPLQDLDRREWSNRGGGYSHTLPIQVCAAQRGRDFEAPDLERGIHFRGVF